MILEKNDISLYYEVRGEGEALVLIHGLIVDAELYENAAKMLSHFYKVITFDRRGNSRSRFKDGFQPEFSMDKQADDIKDLLDELGIERAYMAGASAGAALGAHFLCRYPEMVEHLIMFEPAMLSMVLDSDPEAAAWVDQLFTKVNKGKLNSAMMSFVNSIGEPDLRGPAKTIEDSIRQLENMDYAFKTEFPELIKYSPDIDYLRLNSSKITIAAGEKSEGSKYHKLAGLLAERTGKKLLFFPGGHNLPSDLPEEFAICIIGTLELVKKSVKAPF